MSNVFFAADLHLGHKNVHRFRTQFQSPEEHEVSMVESVLSVGGKRNVLWLLGDCFFTEESLDYLKEFKNSFMQVNFVIGNHDGDNATRQENLRKIFIDNLCDKVYSLVKYKGFWLSHAPIHHEELRGCKNIHGHCHDFVISDVENYRCVSMEQINYKPINFKDIWKEGEV